MTIDVPLESRQGNILNYSIISSDEEENPLVLKLKVSQFHNSSSVVLKRLENGHQYKGLPESTKGESKCQDFDMDLGLQAMLTPRKRGRPTKNLRTPTSKDDIDKLCVSIADKVKLTTPVKRSLAQTDFAETDNGDSNVSPKKRGSVNVQETPARRSSRRLISQSPTKSDENGITRSSKRKSCAPVKFVDEIAPRGSVKANLKESYRKAVLRNRNNVENIKKSPQDIIKNKGTPRRNTRKPYAHNYSEEEEAVQVAKALEKSEIETSSRKRVLRSRSNSSSSSIISISDDDNGLEGVLLTGRRRFALLRSEGNSESSESVISMDTSYVPKESTPKSRKTTSRKKTPENLDIDESPERLSPKKTAPKTPKNRISTPKIALSTPKNRLKMLRDGTITPSMHPRRSAVPGDSTPLMKARAQLHVSYVPTSLPCREREYSDVCHFLKGKLEDGCGGCMYISGVPGTGKTATVTSVIDHLVNDKKTPRFSYVSINGMRLTEPKQAYVEIWKQLTGKTVPWEQAQSLLEERFTKKKKLGPVVMLIDELDILCTKRQDVVYNLLDWPTKCKDQLIVITIANTMDLPERLLMSRVTSRLGLTRLTFQAYTHKQLMEIVTKRLTGTDSFNSDAVQLVARKVASVSGDARRALDICRRAAELAEEGDEGQQVNIMHINEALTAMATQPQVLAIRRSSRLQKLLLQAVVAEIERTGVEETTFADVLRMLRSCCALDGFKMVTGTSAQRALYQLSACKLLLTDQKGGDIYQKIILNVSVHDVYFALKKE